MDPYIGQNITTQDINGLMYKTLRKAQLQLITRLIYLSCAGGSWQNKKNIHIKPIGQLDYYTNTGI